MKIATTFVYCCLISLLHTPTLIAQNVSAKQTDKIGNGTPTKAKNGDVIKYKVEIKNNDGINPATGIQLNAVPDAKTTFVNGSFVSTSVAVNDLFACTGNVGINIPAGNGVLVNDFDDNLNHPMLTLTCNNCNPTANGGTVTLNNDGSFLYIPAAGYTGSDQFTYTINDATIPDGATPLLTDITATVSITISNMIWFIDNSSVAALSDGRRSSPFKTLAAFNTINGDGGLNPAVGHTIYIEHTGTNYTGGVMLLDNQIIIGEGHTGTGAANENLSVALAFALAPFSLALPNIDGSRPIITNASGDGITLAANNNLRGFDVGNCSDFGMENTGTNSIGNLVINEVSINNTTGGGFDASNDSGASMNVFFTNLSSIGGTNGINLINCAGVFTANGGIITNPTGTGVNINGGSVIFAYAGNISDNTGLAVDVDNHDSGNATFSGSITSTAQGIRVQNCGGGTKTFSGTSKSLSTAINNAVTLSSNTGAAINFTGGGLVINTTTGLGFTATGGGTVSVQGAGNSINSTIATALNIINTTIGVSNLNFQSISAGTAAGGPTKGIVLNNTGSGGLTVTGIGTNDGSGGVIQDALAGTTMQRGIELITAQNISLNNMTVLNACRVNGAVSNGTSGGNENTDENGAIHLQNMSNVNLINVDINGSLQHGINGNNITNLDISNSTIQNTGNAVWESGIYIFQLKGTLTNSKDNIFNNVTITTTGQFNMFIQNNDATNAFPGQMDRLSITNSTFLNSGVNVPGDHVTIANRTNANFQTILNNCTFTATAGQTSDSFQADAGDASHQDVQVSNSTFSNGNIAINISGAGTSSTTFNVFDNPSVTSRAGTCVNFASNGSAALSGIVTNNSISTTVNNNAGFGIDIVVDQTGSATIDVNNNIINGNAAMGFSTGIRAGARNPGVGTAAITIRNNTITAGGNFSFAGLWAFAGNGSAGEANQVCLNLSNNTIDVVGAGAVVDYYLEQFTGNTFQLQGLAPAMGATAAQVIAFIAGTDLDPSPTDPTVDVSSGTIVSYTGGICNTP